jgi:two-component system, NarL family, nitrate/nitrite response regulator NarL
MVQRQRVLVVDDHPVFRRGLRTMLEIEDWVEEVLEAATATEAFQLAVTHHADVIVMDLALAKDSGIEVTRRIVRALPEAKVLVLTMSDDERHVQDALSSGACGYLLKDTEPDMVIDALRTVAGGGIVLSGRGVLAAFQRAPAELPPPFDQLNPRERAILRYLAEGETNARIARRIGVSEKTIRNQLSVIFGKLGVRDRVQAALRARDARIT